VIATLHRLAAVRAVTRASSEKRLVARRDRGNKGSTAALPPEQRLPASAAEARVVMTVRAGGVMEVMDPVVAVRTATAEHLSGHRSTLWPAGEGLRQTSGFVTPCLATEARLGRTGL
jgi:hypothetical protein